MYVCMYVQYTYMYVHIYIYHPYIEARECCIYSRFSVSSLICPLHTGITHVIKVLEPCSSHAVKRLYHTVWITVFLQVYICTYRYCIHVQCHQIRGSLILQTHPPIVSGSGTQDCYESIMRRTRQTPW